MDADFYRMTDITQEKMTQIGGLADFFKAVDPLLLFGSDEEGGNQLNEWTYNVGVQLSKTHKSLTTPRQ